MIVFTLILRAFISPTEAFRGSMIVGEFVKQSSRHAYAILGWLFWFHITCSITKYAVEWNGFILVSRQREERERKKLLKEANYEHCKLQRVLACV